MNDDDVRPTDEELVAYVDGELDEAARARVAALARRPDVARRLADFARSRAALRAVAEADATTGPPVPAGIADAAARLAAALERRAAAVGAAQALAGDPPVAPPVQDDSRRVGHVVSIGSGPRASRRPWVRWTGVGAALAASVVLVVALVVVRSTPAKLLALDAGDTIAAGHPLHAAFERTPSGTSVALDGAVARPWLTFRATSGAPCRELEVAAGGSATLAVACRESGGWRVVAAERGLARTPTASGAFVPAGAPESARVDDAIERLSAGDALSAELEARLLAAGWE